MENKITINKEDKTKEKSLNDLISNDGRIKRNNIIDAEEISYNNVYKNVTYDEYGFANIAKNKNS